MSVSIPVTSVELEREHTKYPTMHAGCIAEIKRLRVALAREVRQWTHLEQEIGGHVAEIRELRAEVERLKAALRDDTENRQYYKYLTRPRP